MSAPQSNEGHPDRFTQRLEAFSDLVFGFSLSLLATRLEVPSSAAGIWDRSKLGALVITFAIICVMWLEHYRIFRYHFVAHRFAIVTNFVFLFALALLPYALQTFIRFQAEPSALMLYLADLSLIFCALATLQLSGLLQRQPDMDEAIRLRDWQRTVSQYLGSIVMGAAIILLANGVTLSPRTTEIFGGVLVVAMFGLRRGLRRVPRFLQPRLSS